jgi:uncharacterized cupin superfamily protein
MTKAIRAIVAEEASLRTKLSNYPPEFARRMEGRLKRPLGDNFGLTRFGVNITTLKPGAVSALHHSHSKQDEFIYVVRGKPTLFVDDDTIELKAGMCAGFSAGGISHHLENRTEDDVTILEVGDRSAGDTVSYPNDDIVAVLINGKWQFARKDGTSF